MLDLEVSGEVGVAGTRGSETGYCLYCVSKVGMILVAKVGKWIQRGMLGFL